MARPLGKSPSRHPNRVTSLQESEATHLRFKYHTLTGPSLLRPTLWHHLAICPMYLLESGAACAHDEWHTMRKQVGSSSRGPHHPGPDEVAIPAFSESGHAHPGPRLLRRRCRPDRWHPCRHRRGPRRASMPLRPATAAPGTPAACLGRPDGTSLRPQRQKDHHERAPQGRLREMGRRRMQVPARGVKGAAQWSLLLRPLPSAAWCEPGSEGKHTSQMITSA